MSKSLSAFVFLSLFPVAASANILTIHFGRPEYVPPTTDFVADDAYVSPGGVPGVTQPPGTYTLGIWAEIECDLSGSEPLMDIWNGMNINIIGTGVTVSDLMIDNFDHQIGVGTAYRWVSDCDFGGGDNSFYVYGLGTAWGLRLGGLCPPEFELGDGLTDWWAYTSGVAGTPGAEYHYWLGNVTLAHTDSTAANVFFQIGYGGIARHLGSAAGDPIFFGEDEPISLRGDQYLATSSLPDFVFIPEPDALVLLIFGAASLRRR
jgi:hypothetical protein